MDAGLRRGPIPLRLGILAALGYLVAIYGGPGHTWVRHYLSDVLFEMFFCLLVFTVAPAWPVPAVAACVFAGTCLIELLQPWRPTGLEAIRQTPLGQILLGTTFDLWDFVFYAVGCAMGTVWLGRLKPVVAVQRRKEAWK